MASTFFRSTGNRRGGGAVSADTGGMLPPIPLCNFSPLVSVRGFSFTFAVVFVCVVAVDDE